MVHVLHTVLGIVGNVLGFLLFLAPAITFKKIIKKRTTDQFSGMSYVMALLNCLLSAWYGLPVVSSHNMLVSIVNGAGIVFESIYVLIFLIFAPKKEKTKIFGLLVLVLTILAADVLVSILVLHGSKRKVFAGIATTVFSTMMYGSPLSVMRLVIQTRNVEYMPFFLSLAVFLCATSWLIYGVIGKDTFIIIPNSFGCVLGAMQLILYAIYHNNKGPGTPGDEQV